MTFVFLNNKTNYYTTYYRHLIVYPKNVKSSQIERNRSHMGYVGG